ncbi:hypothetical protein AMK34_21935 [Amycolatopsis sp. CB00013]|nr:hypothetical protein AMK34_21935 [Amycolatopsis sp. CB00013]
MSGIPSTGADVSTKIEIDVDGQLKGTYMVQATKPMPIEIAVKGAQRLRIALYAPAPLRTPLQAGVDSAGGVQHVLPDVALGKPTLLP